MYSKRLEIFLADCFRRYASLIGRRPLLFFLLPLIMTVLLAPGTFFVQEDDNIILLFTPLNAPSRKESTIFNEFSIAEPLIDPNQKNQTADPDEGKKSYFLLQTAKNKPTSNPWIFISACYINGSNIMNVNTWEKIGDMIDYIYHNFTCQVHKDGSSRYATKMKKILRYNPDFCNAKNEFECPPYDKQVRLIQDLMNHSSKSTNNSKVRLTYPVMYLWDRPINWGQFLYGVEVNKTDSMLISAKEAIFKLEFQYELNDEELVNNAHQCMDQLAKFVFTYNKRADKDPNLKWEWNGERYQNREVGIMKTKLLPFIPLTAGLVTIFAIISSYYARSPITGVLEASLGVLTIGLSLVASFGFLFAVGVPLNFVITMTPCLTLCVGIDNDFLLMSAWRRPFLERLSTKERLARAFMDAGPSLTITSINDILCFAVGCLSESPAIRDFCLFTCVTLAFRFFYQLTFFSGALVYLNDYEYVVLNLYTKIKSKLIEIFRPKYFLKYEQQQEIRKIEPNSNNSEAEITTSTSNSELDLEKGGGCAVEFLPPAKCNILEKVQPISNECGMHRFFARNYSKILAKRGVRILIVLAFSAYLIFSLIFAMRLEVNVTLKKLVYDDSPLQSTYDKLEEFVSSTQIGNVIVSRAPDFRRAQNVQRFLEFVSILERTPEFSPDPKDTTTLWLRDYLDFRSYMDSSVDSDFYDYLDAFFQSSHDNARYAKDLRFRYSEDGQLILESFRFTVFYQNVSTYDNSAKLMLLWRKVCANYSEYDAIVQDYFFRNTYFDIRLTVSGTTLQTMGIASLMIAFVTSLLMPDACSMFFICFSSLSVDLGVIAMLNIWGSDLDPVTMVCLLMTIGFSVYYTARMCYCYQKSEKQWTTEMKLSYTLGTVGWPILQGGLGTWIGIVPVAFVGSYMTRTFFRTIVLVVGIGLLHGLVFMPVMMSLYDRRVPAFRKRRMKNH